MYINNNLQSVQIRTNISDYNGAKLYVYSEIL